ncbi:hypothetical protein BASA62_005436 [Batrachochytrium salamandrivorans]|nr:hypothetical protein BASA62_005436 [Batrachochytrium salamandrivorans]
MMLRSVSLLRSAALRSAVASTATARPSVLIASRVASRTLATTTSSPSSEPTNTGSETKSSGNTSALVWLSLGALAAGAGYYFYTQDDSLFASTGASKPVDYQAVYNAIAKVLEDNDYDDGSFGPVLLRLAWHAAGTYDKTLSNGGSNGSTMRFNPESTHGANAGLVHARARLEPIKKMFPGISYADLWSLAGVVAVQEMGGPTIPWRSGRVDADTSAACTPDGRLPDATQSHDHLRNIFYRMGFNDQEIVALSGAHSLGRCHTDRSGFDGPWSFSPTTFSNSYFKLLLSEKWVDRKWDALRDDRVFKKFVDLYAKDEAKFFEDFAKAFQKLEELGVPFKDTTPVLTFKAL